MCIDKLFATSCKRIVYLQEYPHSEGRLQWIERGRQIDWIFDLIDDESPVHMFANIYGFGGEK
jgi:deoxycytidylate deaminase